MLQIINQNYKILIIIILLILFLVFFENFENESDVMIVISRYNEDLEWLKEEPFNKYPVIVYNKGNNDNFYKSPKIQQVIYLENVGREGHTYLYHIINNYNNLNNITLFLPGSINIERKKLMAISIINEIEKNNKTAFLLLDVDDSMYNFHMDNYESSDNKNKILNVGNKTKESDIRPFGEWFKKYVNSSFLTKTSYCGIFSVTRENIIKNNIEYYIQFINQVNDHHNPEVGHYLERSWYTIFNPDVTK
jgi:hypothetical protein